MLVPMADLLSVSQALAIRKIPNSGGRQSHCFTSLAIVWSKKNRQIEVEFASPLVGVHPVTFARFSEQNQEKRSLGGK